ncbi:MAG: hypothetical protein QM813_10710 [Verrucomicrobiota bacterium]
MNRRDFLSSIGVASLAAGVPLSSFEVRADELASLATSRPKQVLQTFDYRGVKLLAGRFRRQVEQARETYFNLSSDDILKGFRREAGIARAGQ